MFTLTLFVLICQIPDGILNKSGQTFATQLGWKFFLKKSFAMVGEEFMINGQRAERFLITIGCQS